MESVYDLGRPDVDGVPPKMKTIADQLAKEVEGMVPYNKIEVNDNLMSNLSIYGSFDPEKKWMHSIWRNSRYFRFDIIPEKEQRYYESGSNITVSLFAHHTLPKFRRYTGTPEKVIQKIKNWIQKFQDTEDKPKE